MVLVLPPETQLPLGIHRSRKSEVGRRQVLRGNGRRGVWGAAACRGLGSDLRKSVSSERVLGGRKEPALLRGERFLWLLEHEPQTGLTGAETHLLTVSGLDS